MLENNIDEIVKQNHCGARCWLNFKNICHETRCIDCPAFLAAVRNAVKKVTVVDNSRVPEVVSISV